MTEEVLALEGGALQTDQDTARVGTDMAVGVEGDVWVDRPICSARDSRWMQSAVDQKVQQ